MSDVRFGRINYNPARGAFQARIDIERGGHVFRYPCEVRGPLDMDEQIVRHALAAQAQAMSDSPRATFSHR
ncbi:hypothetical protein [Wenxinia marina]|uniref:Orotidine 5'-phosphate decarboxylase n=1 Tax=Wenxinia marina DSM 24838 TaxID=1123501 RepID=A0A0D0PIY5_9RHOB|nr:hypothetical protein [Wenxinia marina]KIQ71356.1 hypothetical protein Wenmar_00133 [Wenxinia marina DSM 24838]GGL81348.1 hypothetical protein GCM10011392_39970 [Wenxinia marina]